MAIITTFLASIYIYVFLRNKYERTTDMPSSLLCYKYLSAQFLIDPMDNFTPHNSSLFLFSLIDSSLS